MCSSYHIPFSFSLAQGGYIHENGEYTEEGTLVISLIDVDKDIINEIAKDLCVFFHQESVLITEDRVRAYFINQPSKRCGKAHAKRLIIVKEAMMNEQDPLHP